MKAYLALHPGHEFALDEEAGIVAVVLPPAPDAPGPPDVLAWSHNLLDLLDKVNAPPAASLS